MSTDFQNVAQFIRLIKDLFLRSALQLDAIASSAVEVADREWGLPAVPARHQRVLPLQRAHGQQAMTVRTRPGTRAQCTFINIEFKKCKLKLKRYMAVFMVTFSTLRLCSRDL